MILDTSFIIDIMENDGKAIEKLSYLVKKGEPLLITAPTIFELFSGVARSKRPNDERSKTETILKNQMVLHMDYDTAERAGEIDGILAREGKMIGVVDCMIAGIALVKKEKVMTRNVKDFQRIRGLEIETY